MTPDQAEIFALQALAYVAGDEKLAQALQVQSGLDGDSLRQSLDNPVVLGAILDFLLDDEKRLIGCCEALGWAPELPAQARRALPGTTSGIWQ